MRSNLAGGLLEDVGCRVYGVGYRVQSVGCRVQGVGCRVWGGGGSTSRGVHWRIFANAAVRIAVAAIPASGFAVGLSSTVNPTPYPPRTTYVDF